MLTVHVVSHTHWDREWYHPAERFRQRLVALIDELLDDPPGDGSSFLLDGQTVVLEDYLHVRPERASELASALRDGRLEAGPWFVLADELIPSGEALARNLLAGRRTLRALRASPPPVLYCPDSFGHPATLPELARGFGCGIIILWRGLAPPSGAASDTFRWTAPSRESALVYHLTRTGYEFGANLPLDDDGARRRWQELREQLAPRSRLETTLLLNGADHHARQAARADAVRALIRVAAPDAVRSSSLSEFARDVERGVVDVQLPELHGELRDSYGYTWTLQGTLASRAPQKRRYVRRERELSRDMEPWAALAAFYGRESRRHFVNAAWHPLLLCQPHDTLCGCNIDAVARAMDLRLESAGSQAAGVREDAMLDWLGHDRDDARQNRDRWMPALVVRNRAPRARSGVAIVELTSTIADIPVGPGSSHVAISRRVLPKTPRLADAAPAQVLSRRLDNDRVEAPRHYPDNDAVSRLQAAVWVENVPAYGVRSFPFTTARTRTPRNVERVQAEAGRIANAHITLRWDEQGGLVLEHGPRVLRNFIEWESRRDRGDLYTPAIREPKLTPRLLNTRLVHRGPWRASVEQRWRLRDAESRVDARVRFVLDAGARWLRVHVVGVNAARDHRLRLRFLSDVSGGKTFADTAFANVERRAPRVAEEAALVEEPVPTAPLHRYVSLFNERQGATVFSDGLTEYETSDSAIAITLLRCVGELSRSDIAERPGHAGWPAPTPEAQCPGPFDAELALLLHGPRTAAVVSEIDTTADDVLYPLVGETLRSALKHHPPLHGVALEGAGLSLSAIKESDDGEFLVLRCVNLLDTDVAGTWRFARAPAEAHLARLDETPLTPLKPVGDTIPFVAPPRAIVTLLAR